MDLYPRLEGESDKDYGERLKKINQEEKQYAQEENRISAQRKTQWKNASEEERMLTLRHEGDDMTMLSMTPEAEAKRAEFERKRAEIRARNNQNNSQS